MPSLFFRFKIREKQSHPASGLGVPTRHHKWILFDHLDTYQDPAGYFLSAFPYTATTKRMVFVGVKT
jgi:hypothetical protein